VSNDQNHVIAHSSSIVYILQATASSIVPI